MSDFEKLINASDLIEWIMETYPDWCEGDVRLIVDHVKALPSAQPTIEPRAKGEWIKPTGMMPPEHAGHYECSNCGFWAMRDWLRPRVVLTKFCPNCGWEMQNG